MEHSVIRLTGIKQYFVIKNNFRSFSEWPFYPGFTVFAKHKTKIPLTSCNLSSVLTKSGVNRLLAIAKNKDTCQSVYLVSLKF